MSTNTTLLMLTNTKLKLFFFYIHVAVKVTRAGEQHVMNLRLPVVPAKFALPVTITASDFDSAWGGCVFGGTVRSYIEALLLRLFY